MKKALTFLNLNFERCFLVANMGSMIIIIFLQVVMRYVFNNSLSWTEELARYLFVWQCWVGVSYAVMKGRHIRVDIIKDLVNAKGKYVFDLIYLVVSILFLIFLSYNAAIVVSAVKDMNQLTPALQMPKWIPYFSVLVGSVLTVLRLVQQLIVHIKNRKEIIAGGA